MNQFFFAQTPRAGGLRRFAASIWLLFFETRMNRPGKIFLDLAPAAALLLGCVLAGGGCALVKKTAQLPANTMAAVLPNGQPAPPDPAILQAELQRYSDDFCGRTSVALDEYASRVNTPGGRTEALQWKVAVNSSAIAIATGPNPTADLLDFVSLATLVRTFLDEQTNNPVAAEALVPWLKTSRHLETNAWKMADRVLTSTQQAEFQAVIRRWSAQNTNLGITFFARPQDFVAGPRQSGQSESLSGSVFNLVGLDPMAGLDPAVREITRSRLFGERALFALERMPVLVRWQTDLLADQMLARLPLTNALASADRLSGAVESASQTAARLPDQISAERKAILDALDAQEGRLAKLSTDLTRTLTAGEQMSTSVNTTLITFDALMKRFGVGEPATAPPDTNSPPFNILDYARTAGQVADAAQKLDVLIKDAGSTLDSPALDKRIADLNELSERTQADAKSVLNHAFFLGAGLILLGFACALIYRRVGLRGSHKPATQKESESKP